MKVGYLDDKERAKKAVEKTKLIEKYWNDPTHSKTTHRVIIGDSRNMVSVKDNSVHLIITSPPYYNAKEYSQWQTLQSYLEDMKKTFKECFRVLVPGRKFCLNISDLPEKGESGVRWIPLGAETERVAQEVGFELVDRIIWFKTPVKGFQYGSLPFPPSPLICDSMEYIFVLRKPGKNGYSHLTKNQKEASRLKRSEYAEYTKQMWTMARVRLKDNILAYNPNFLRGFVRGLMDTDGFVGISNICFAVVSKSLVLNFKDILFLFNIESKFFTKIRERNRKDLHFCRVNRPYLDLYHNLFGFSNQRKLDSLLRILK